MTTNPELELAWQCIERTGSHLFLTGKAGTGKTTFLRKLKEKSPKRMVVVAPTGIAAINAGGVTIHSFFQLSFAPYIPETTFTSKQTPYKFGKEKINIIRSMDLLVIDEISMVRSDLLDAVDSVLRRYKDRYKPFGGVQLLMIGDLQQLAPVVKDDEWAMLSKYYDTPYFFGSNALKSTEYITIQLEHVYRQSDTHFLTLLNKIRTNDIDDHVLAELNKRYIPGFQPHDDEGYIRLTTHNYQAQRINDKQLSLLPGRAMSYKAQIKGNFPETAYPADVELVIKPGAQIMFIKNDTSNEKRYYNGKIGIVVAVDKNNIRVRGNGDSHDFLLDTEDWTNSKYTLNSATKEITEEIEGTFTQYPIRLAWAITIHKSQGLTFEHAIIDANSSFAHGQVYVALSRCKTLEGMVLGSRLDRSSIISDDSVDEYTRKVENTVPDKSRLNELMQRYYYDLVCEQFDFAVMSRYFSALIRIFDEHFYKLYPKQLEKLKENYDRFLNEIEKISTRFQMEYSVLIMNDPNYITSEKLQQRIKAGAGYFEGKVQEIIVSLLSQTQIVTDNKELKKKFTDAYVVFNESVLVKAGTLAHTAKEGFNVSDYLKNKARLLVSLSEKEKPSSARKPRQKSPADKPGRTDRYEKVEVSADILHPELYTRLLRWRGAEAARTKQPAYTILQQKAIIGITNLLPTDADELLRIPYCGSKSVDRFGAAILNIVRKFVNENNISHKQKTLL